MNGNQKAMWSASKGCYVAVDYDHPETLDLKNHAPLTGFQHLFDRRPNEDPDSANKRIDMEIKTKCIEFAVDYCTRNGNMGRGFKVEEVAAEFYKFYTTSPQ